MAPNVPPKVDELAKQFAGPDMANFLQSSNELPPSEGKMKISEDFIRAVQQHLNRKKNEAKDSKQTRAKKLKAKKAARRVSNKSRKINQAKNRKNKFTR